MVSVFMGAQVVALDVTLDAMALLGQAKGPDEEFLRHTLRSCTDVYTVHAAMVDSAMAADMDTLTVMRQVYRADPDGSAAAFNRLIDDFKMVKHRMLARA
jgi:predicted RNA methylase